MTTATTILIILLLTLINSVFAMSEGSPSVSSRKGRLQQWANEGDRRAQAALDLANHPTCFLSTVQIGITLVGILAGTLVVPQSPTGSPSIWTRCPSWRLTVGR